LGSLGLGLDRGRLRFRNLDGFRGLFRRRLDFWRGFFNDWPRRLLHDAHRAFHGRIFFRKVLVANFFREFFRDRIRGNTDVDTFAPHLFNQALGINLQLFG